MAARSPTSDPGLPRSRFVPGSRSDHPASALRTVLVRYEGTPDRCTIYPRASDDKERQVTWISVDLDVVVDLETVR